MSDAHHSNFFRLDDDTRKRILQGNALDESQRAESINWLIDEVRERSGWVGR